MPLFPLTVPQSRSHPVLLCIAAAQYHAPWALLPTAPSLPCLSAGLNIVSTGSVGKPPTHIPPLSLFLAKI